jgi:hypothetical protein
MAHGNLICNESNDDVVLCFVSFFIIFFIFVSFYFILF